MSTGNFRGMDFDFASSIFEQFCRGQGVEFDLGDIFGAFTGQRRKRKSSQPRRGSHLQVSLPIDLEDIVVDDRDLTISLKKPDVCPSCNGVGGKESVKCKTCNGTGMTTTSQGGYIQISQTCHSCHGTGTTIKKKCQKCKGSGQVEIKKDLSFTVPAGCPEGYRIIISNEGAPGKNGGPKGDVHVIIQTRPHEYFVREGPHLHCILCIDFVQAILGDKVSLNTLTDEIVLSIPPGTMTGDVLKVENQGLKIFRGSDARGNLLVTIEVTIPEDITQEQRELLEKYREISKPDPYLKNTS
jgi:molecular chaperone DnaJ